MAKHAHKTQTGMQDWLHEAKFVWSDDGRDHTTQTTSLVEVLRPSRADASEHQCAAKNSQDWLSSFRFDFGEHQRGERGQSSSHDEVGEQRGIYGSHDWSSNLKLDFSQFHSWAEHLSDRLHPGHEPSYNELYPSEADGGNSPPPLYVPVDGLDTEFQINPAVDLLQIQTDWLLS